MMFRKDKSPEKIKIEKQVLYLHDENKPFTWASIKNFKFEDDDIIEIGRDEGYYSDNNSWDPFFFVRVTRMVLETDEEYKDRLEDNERDSKKFKSRRYERFLELKREFDEENNL